MEHGEDLVAALVREVREESGCEVEVGGLLGVYSNLGRPEGGVPEQVHLVFACEWVRGEPRAGGECLEAGWFGVEEALGLVGAPQQRAKLEDALAGSGLRYRAFRTRPYESVLGRRLDGRERR